jgi:hypothetical protein
MTRDMRRHVAGGVEVWTTLGRRKEERAPAQGLTTLASGAWYVVVQAEDAE